MAVPTRDQEKLEIQHKSPERRPHNDAPSQKTAMPRWPRRGKGKSTMAHVCSWIVEHQIGELSFNDSGVSD